MGAVGAIGDARLVRGPTPQQPAVSPTRGRASTAHGSTCGVTPAPLTTGGQVMSTEDAVRATSDKFYSGLDRMDVSALPRDLVSQR